MDHLQALRQYTETAVETGSPARLVAMLYQGALKYIAEAEEAIGVRDAARKGNQINRALRIVQELGNALDESAAPELVDRLRQLYEYVEYELLEASTTNDARHLDHARRVLQRLATAWEELADRNVAPAAPGPVATKADTDAVPARESIPGLTISA